jgi:hypothetical protein
MWKKYRLWLALALALSCLVTLLLLLLPPASRITKAAFEKTQPGMSLAEVEVIMGGPSGDYRTGEVEDFLKLVYNSGLPREERPIDLFTTFILRQRPNCFYPPKPFYRVELWAGDEGLVWVGLDEDERVLKKQFTPWRPLPMTPLDRLHWWLERWRQR